MRALARFCGLVLALSAAPLSARAQDGATPAWLQRQRSDEAQINDARRQRLSDLKQQIIRSNPCGKEDAQRELTRVFNSNDQFTKTNGRIVALSNMTTDMVVLDAGMLECLGTFSFENHHQEIREFTFPYIFLAP